MGKMIDAPSEFSGERKVWESFRDFLPDSSVVYNNRLINGFESDFCILLEGYGIVVVEVKGWKQDGFKVRGTSEVYLPSTGLYEARKDGNPYKQARRYSFDIKNEMKKTFRIDPIVVSMVAYPNISSMDFENLNLSQFCSANEVLFLEDLQDPYRLLNKMQNLFIPHMASSRSRFSQDLVKRIRDQWEIGQEPVKKKAEGYSNLFILSKKFNDPDQVNTWISWMLEEYKLGAKQIIFVEDEQLFFLIRSKVVQTLKDYGLRAKGLNLEYAQSSESDFSHDVNKSFKIFNFEIYFTSLNGITDGPVVNIREGQYTPDQEIMLLKLSEITNFNMGQYLVEHAPVNENSVVLAGAGTGKSYSLISRISFLMLKQEPALENLLEDLALITFTNEASKNVKSNLKQHFLNYFILTKEVRFIHWAQQVEQASISTIHFFLLKLMRLTPGNMGLGKDFALDDSLFTRQQIYENYLNSFVQRMQEEDRNFISGLGTHLHTLRDTLIQLADDILSRNIGIKQLKGMELGTSLSHTLPHMTELIKKVLVPAEDEYEKKIQELNQMPLRKVTSAFLEALEANPAILNQIGPKYIFIDEFQDTDDVQIEVFTRIARQMESSPVFHIVGDLKQSIYRFRGATLSAFDQIKKSYQKYKWNDYYLKKNYRSDYRLLQAFSPIFQYMGNNHFIPYTAKDELTSTVEAEANKAPFIEKIEFDLLPSGVNRYDERDQKFIEWIQKKRLELNNQIADNKLCPEDAVIAVLTRKNSELRNIVQLMEREGIPVFSSIRQNVYQTEAARDYLRLCMALSNSNSLQYLTGFISSNFIRLDGSLLYLKEMDPEEQLEEVRTILNEFFRTQTGISWESWVEKSVIEPPLYVIYQLFNQLSPWMNYSEHSGGQLAYRDHFNFLHNILFQKITKVPSSISKITDYLGIQIQTGQVQYLPQKAPQSNEAHVEAMTIHGSKGLEFHTVVLPSTDFPFIQEAGKGRGIRTTIHYSDNKLGYRIELPGMNANMRLVETNTIFNELTEQVETEKDESRILYVAMTRAKNQLAYFTSTSKNQSLAWSDFMEAGNEYRNKNL